MVYSQYGTNAIEAPLTDNVKRDEIQTWQNMTKFNTGWANII